MVYVSPKSVKGQAIFDRFIKLPLEDKEYEDTEFPDDGILMLEAKNKWQMFFDGAEKKRGYQIRVLLIDPLGCLHTNCNEIRL